MASNLPPGYCDETHSWRGFAAGNCGEPPFPTQRAALTPAPATPVATDAAGAGEAAELADRIIRNMPEGISIHGNIVEFAGFLLTHPALRAALPPPAPATVASDAAGEAVTTGDLYMLRMALMSAQLRAATGDTCNEAYSVLNAANQEAIDTLSKLLKKLTQPAPPHPATPATGATAEASPNAATNGNE